MPLSTRELYSIYGELQRLILCCLQLILQGLTPVKCEDGNLWRCVKNLHKVSEGSHNLTRWVFPKIVGFPPKSCILIGFSIINYKPSILGPLESTPPSKFHPCLSSLSFTDCRLWSCNNALVGDNSLNESGRLAMTPNQNGNKPIR